MEAAVKLQKQKAKSIVSIYLELSKLNILSLVLVATFLGYYIGNNGIGSWILLTSTLMGTAMTSAGAGALNHYLERKPDQLMNRTKNRPLPAGTISPLSVIIYGVLMVVFGSIILFVKVNITENPSPGFNTPSLSNSLSIVISGLAVNMGAPYKLFSISSILSLIIDSLSCPACL